MFRCVCLKQPSQGLFTVGKAYGFTLMIDAWATQDDAGEKRCFGDGAFHLHFSELEPVTSDCRMLMDGVLYRVYLLPTGERYAIDNIKACAKVWGVNYLQAKQKLAQAQPLIAQGNAYRTRDVLKELARFKVRYRVEPPFPYDLPEIPSPEQENASQ